MRRFLGIVLLTCLLLFGCGKQGSTTQQKPSQSGSAASTDQATIARNQAASEEPPKSKRTGDFVTEFGGLIPAPSRRDTHVLYSLNPSVEKFFVHVPSDYTGATAYGPIVFTDADDTSRQLPDGWQRVLDGRRYLYIAPQNAGNDQNVDRRLGLGVLAALEMAKYYNIDRNRIYAAGYSGGARMSGMLGFYQGDLFTGTIQNCGADFYRRVPTVLATSSVDTAGQPYGLFDANTDEVTNARNVRFVLITGSEDFRRGNIVDIFEGGFAHDGFQAKLFDVRGMGHDTADSRTLSAALDFLEASP